MMNETSHFKFSTFGFRNEFRTPHFAFRTRPHSALSGSAALVALIVITIIMLVLVNTWFKEDPETGEAAPIISDLQKADHAAALGNLYGLNQELQMKLIDNPGQKFTVEDILEGRVPPHSRSGGVYVMGTDDRIYFTGYTDTAPPAPMLIRIIPIHIDPEDALDS